MTNYEYDLHANYNMILDKNKYKGQGLTGLVNLGNKCFLNSILQCLSNTLKLTDYLLSAKYRSDDPEQSNKRKKEYYIVLSYLNLLINIWDTNQVLKPKSFVENISKFIKKYFTLEQQDSHECLMYILDFLHIGLGYEVEVDIQGTVKNENDKLIKQSLEQWKTFYEKRYSFIIETFNGMFYNKITCNNCKKDENVFEPFNCISVNVNDNFINLENCLDDYFFKAENIPTWNCESCDTNPSGCSKEIKAWTFPDYLIIHFKRFENNGKKINKIIDFPKDDLDLTKYISPQKADPNNYIYSLYAINYHSGNSESGHYWSVCKNLNNNWYLYNDSDITKFTNQSILSKDAYILFYHRKYIGDTLPN